VAPSVTFTARGHENIRAKHVRTLEFTREAHLTERGDCIIGVSADFSLDELRALSGKILLRVRVDDMEDTFKAKVNEGFDDEDEVVFRKGGYRSSRTYGLGLDRGSNRLDRRIVERMRDPEAVMTVTIEERGHRHGRSTG